MIPASAEDVQAVVRLCHAHRVPVRRARCRHRPLGRGAAGRRRDRDLARPPEPRARGGSRARPDRRRARGDEPRDHEGRRGRRLLLRAGSIEPAGLHDRRQRRRELGRRPLPEARLHGQPRSRGRCRPRRRRRSSPSPATTKAPICSVCSSARRARSASPSASSSGCSVLPRRCARCSPDSRTTDAAGDAVSHTISAGILPVRDRDDGRAHDRGGRGRRRRRLSRQAPERC